MQDEKLRNLSRYIDVRRYDVTQNPKLLGLHVPLVDVQVSLVTLVERLRNGDQAKGRSNQAARDSGN